MFLLWPLFSGPYAFSINYLWIGSFFSLQIKDSILSVTFLQSFENGSISLPIILCYFFSRQLSWQMTTFYFMQIKIWIYMCSCKISIHYQNIESLKCREWLNFLLIACRTILQHVSIRSMSLDLSFASKSAYRFQRLWTYLLFSYNKSFPLFEYK